MALGRSSRGGTPVVWIAIHTAEGSRTKESLYSYFDSSQSGSSHVGIDAAGVSPDWVPITSAAWTMLNGNSRSVQAELCAFARWSRAQWLQTESLDGCANPRQIVRNTAVWVARMCRELSIPARRLTDQQIRNGEQGILGHGDYSRATGDGDHSDPGAGFPWDVLLADVNQILGGKSPSDSVVDPNESEEGSMFYTVDLPASPADGSVASKVVALPWTPGGLSGYSRVSCVIAADNADATIVLAHFRLNDKSGRRPVDMVPPGTVIKATEDTGGRAVPPYTYSLIVNYKSSKSLSLAIEAVK